MDDLDETVEATCDQCQAAIMADRKQRSDDDVIVLATDDEIILRIEVGRGDENG